MRPRLPSRLWPPAITSSNSPPGQAMEASVRSWPFASFGSGSTAEPPFAETFHLDEIGRAAARRFAGRAAPQHWPQLRGPNRDFVIPSFRAPASWPTTLKKQWRIAVGTGYATPIVVGNRVFVFTRQENDEVMTAFDARTASVIWRSSYPAPFKMNPATAPHGPGPKSTPTFAGNRLFTLGISGIVSAFDADTGRTIWQKPPPAVEPLYHTAMS